MKHTSLLALPALLRPALYLAAASARSFSVHDDILAFPQFEVEFPESHVTEDEAASRLLASAERIRDDKRDPRDTPPSHPGHDGSSNVRLDGARRYEEGSELFEYEQMTLEGQHFLCAVPQVVKAEEAENNTTLSKAEEERELARATDRGWELLSGMQGQCVYFIGGWWSYRFCYNQGVRQFHQLPPSKTVPMYPPVEDPSVEGYMLGRYQEGKLKGNERDDVEGARREAEGSLMEIGGNVKRWKRANGVGELVQKGESRYLVQKLQAGTACDLTGKDRTIEIQYHCNPQASDRITLIKETSTCTYLMVVQTPRLCNDVAFLPPQKDHPHPISCSPVLADDQVELYHNELARLSAAEAETQIWAEEAANVFSANGETLPILVGDIEVGARNILPDGFQLEKSVIVGGGKEKLLESISPSDVKKMSKEDLEKLGFGDAKTLKQLMKKIEEKAMGSKFKLDIVETARGTEYRAILGEDEEGQEAVQEGGADWYELDVNQQAENGVLDDYPVDVIEEFLAKKKKEKQQQQQQKDDRDGQRDGKESEEESEQGSKEEFFKDEL